MAGHGSFFFLALSYLENDFLNLRLFALSGQISSVIIFIFITITSIIIFFLSLYWNLYVLCLYTGISLSIIFQYYRERPLWIPIKWNALFLLINTVMAMFILKVLQKYVYLALELLQYIFTAYLCRYVCIVCIVCIYICMRLKIPTIRCSHLKSMR